MTKVSRTSRVESSRQLFLATLAIKKFSRAFLSAKQYVWRFMVVEFTDPSLHRRCYFEVNNTPLDGKQ